LKLSISASGSRKITGTGKIMYYIALRHPAFLLLHTLLFLGVSSSSYTTLFLSASPPPCASSPLKTPLHLPAFLLRWLA